MSFSFGETNRPESNPYPENLFLRGSLGLGYAALKARTLAVPPRSGQAHAAVKPDGFVEVSAAHLLAPVPASSVVMEYVAREGGRLTLTVPASSGFDLPALVAALRGS